MALIEVIYAHPYPAHSRACAALVGAVRDVPDLRVHSLYDAYPDFDIDAAAEREALAGAGLVVWLHPLYWYDAPALLKLWQERVLVKGWAYGEGGDALRGKDCLWAVTTGGDAEAYTAGGRHGHPFADFVPAMEQTARYCGMRWLEPFALHGAHLVDDAALAEAGRALRGRLEAWRVERG